MLMAQKVFASKFLSEHITYVMIVGVKGLLANRYLVFCALFASLGGMTFGYDQGVIANVLIMKDFMSRFPLTSTQIGILSASSAYVPTPR